MEALRRNRRGDRAWSRRCATLPPSADRCCAAGTMVDVPTSPTVGTISTAGALPAKDVNVKVTTPVVACCLVCFAGCATRTAIPLVAFCCPSLRSLPAPPTGGARMPLRAMSTSSRSVGLALFTTRPWPAAPLLCHTQHVYPLATAGRCVTRRCAARGAASAPAFSWRRGHARVRVRARAVRAAIWKCARRARPLAQPHICAVEDGQMGIFVLPIMVLPK